MSTASKIRCRCSEKCTSRLFHFKLLFTACAHRRGRTEGGIFHLGFTSGMSVVISKKENGRNKQMLPLLIFCFCFCFYCPTELGGTKIHILGYILTMILVGNHIIAPGYVPWSQTLWNVILKFSSLDTQNIFLHNLSLALSMSLSLDTERGRKNVVSVLQRLVWVSGVFDIITSRMKPYVSLVPEGS